MTPEPTFTVIELLTLWVPLAILMLALLAWVSWRPR